MVLKACRSFDRFFELADGEVHEEWIDEHNLKVPGWVEADVEEFEKIQRRNDQREFIDTVFPGTLAGAPANDRLLCPLIENAP